MKSQAGLVTVFGNGVYRLVVSILVLSFALTAPVQANDEAVPENDCAEILSAFQWPEGNAYADPVALTKFHKKFFKDMGLKRINASKKIVWPGPMTKQNTNTPIASYEEAVDQYTLSYNREHDRDALDTFLYMVFKLGFEQGRRIAFHNHVLPSLKAFLLAKVKLEEKQMKQHIAEQFVFISILMNGKMPESFVSYPLVGAGGNQQDWPLYSRPASYEDLAGLMKKVFLQMFEVKDDTKLEENLIRLMKAGAEQVRRYDLRDQGYRQIVAEHADKAFMRVMKSDTKDYNDLPLYLDYHMDKIRFYIVDMMFADAKFDRELVRMFLF